MSFCASHNPAFWERIANDPACPVELLSKLRSAGADDAKPFKIKNGKRMRAFLRKQLSWVDPDKDGSDGQRILPMATFTDGLGGRVQYRMEFELPAEQSPKKNFDLLRKFSAALEKSNIPFVAAMHAPEQHNYEANWHAYVAFYDRPCRQIDQRDIKEDFIRASGPGGQNVNKVSSSVQLRFNLEGNTTLPDDLKVRLGQLAGSRLTLKGEIILTADRFRNQERNREDALERLLELIRKAAYVPKARKATRPTLASKRRDMESKKQRGNVKKMRNSKNYD